jgi:hypothetical protein
MTRIPTNARDWMCGSAFKVRRHPKPLRRVDSRNTILFSETRAKSVCRRELTAGALDAPPSFLRTTIAQPRTRRFRPDPS